MNHDVRLLVEGSLLERLLQQAVLCGASFARIQRSGPRSMIFTADPASAAIVVRLCERYGLNLRELKRGGLTAAWQLMRRRWTLAPGVLLCAIICVLLLGRIWMVDVAFTGASSGSRAEILDALGQSGVRTGMAAGRIDCNLLQKQLLAETGNYSFIGVRVQGIRLLVETGSEQPAPELYAIEQARDLVARCSGVVEEVSVYSGEACVKPGDTVLAGEVLIRGEETIGKDAETREEITTGVGALGKVVARCWFEGSAEGALQQQVSRRTGHSTSECRLRLMDFSLPIISCEAYASCETKREVTPVVGLFLPLEIERSTHYETTAETVETNPEALRTQLSVLAHADALMQLESADIQYEISSAWLDEKQTGNTLQIRAVYEIYTDIAAERDALIEEVY